MDTDDLENRLLDRCHRWVHNKPVELGVFGPVHPFRTMPRHIEFGLSQGGFGVTVAVPRKEP
jgi:hypothetical protein